MWMTNANFPDVRLPARVGTIDGSNWTVVGLAGLGDRLEERVRTSMKTGIREGNPIPAIRQVSAID